MSETIAASETYALIRGMRLRPQRHLFPTRVLIAAVALAGLPTGALAQLQDAASVIAADRALSVRTAQGIAALAVGSTTDVVFLYPGMQVVHGRGDVRHLLDSVATATHDRLSWSPMRAELSSDGSRAYTYGRGTRTKQFGGRDSVSGIRYIAWWQRDTSDVWRVAAWLLIDEHASVSPTAPWPCTTPTALERSRGSATTADVISADSAFAARSAASGPAAAFAEYVADDGISLGAAGTARCGKHDVGATLAGARPTDLEWSPITGDASGDLGYTAGTATIRGEHGMYYSKYLTIWKRQPDGAWRFVADGGNAAPARLTALAAH